MKQKVGKVLKKMGPKAKQMAKGKGKVTVAKVKKAADAYKKSRKK